MATRRFSSAIPRPHPAHRVSFLTPFRHRTYPSSSVRTVTVLAIAILSFLFITLTLQSLLFPPHRIQPFPVHHQEHSYHGTSRLFRYADHQEWYSFAQLPDHELGVVVGFLASLASNSIPLSVDPTVPIDPQLVLPIDARSRNSRVLDEVRNIVSDTWSRNPVVVFSELHSTNAPHSREVKSLLADFYLHPAPTIFEVDQRVDYEVLRPLIRRLSGTHALPLVIIGGTPVGSIQELRDLLVSGRLEEMVRSSGAIINGDPRKKGRKRT